MRRKILNIIEPTLFDQTGHGFSYVQSLIDANHDFGFDIHVWLNRKGKKLIGASNAVSHAYFWRRMRQIQKLFLYAKLVLQDQIIFVSTAELWDLKVLNFCTKFAPHKAGIFVHFHQFKQNDKKLAALRKLSRHKNITIMAPTDKLIQVFAQAGFKNTRMVPCPTFYPARDIGNNCATFQKIVYAGAARSDKGFHKAVQLLQELRLRENFLPFEMQISAPNSQRFDAMTQRALNLLTTIPDKNLVLHRDTLAHADYLNLFNNSICLLLYDAAGYHDKFSGIALDAFYAGCPIITIRNTWMGDVCQKYQAGLALANCDFDTLHFAIEQIIANYEIYHQNAKRAACELRKLHDPKNTLACFV